MPLLTSPIDGSPMRQLNRFGIELDICPTSGGVWLDRGELEKLMALIKETVAEEQSYNAPQNYPMGQGMGAKTGGMPQQRSQFKDHDDDDNDNDNYRSNKNHRYGDDDNNRQYNQAHPHKKKSGMSRLMEVFEF